jgi:beta-lactamase superfamily II metal-dependent hydrolase
MIPVLRIHQIANSGSRSNGDSTLLQYSDHFRQTNILVDCGIGKSVVMKYLQDIGIKEIDLLVASHIDLDHIGGLREVLSNFDVRWLWVMNIDPLKRFVEKSVGFDRERYHFLKCITMAHESVVTAGQKNVRCSSVYEGFRVIIPPFLVEVLSPPFAFEHFLQDPRNVEKVLGSPKGKTYEDFLKEGARIQEDVSTEILTEREVTEGEIQEQELPSYPESFEYNEEQLSNNFDLASRGLLNNTSVVARITCLAPNCPTSIFEPLAMLFPGDLEDWTYLFLKYSEYINTSILKIPHHGSNGVQFKDRTLYEFLRPHLSLVFPYPRNSLPSPRVIALLARSGLVSCTSCKQTRNAQWKSRCCHIDNNCMSLDSIVYEITPVGVSIKDGRGVCMGTFRS